jgi:uncharacterized protein YqgC (DUF456 family)
MLPPGALLDALLLWTALVALLLLSVLGPVRPLLPSALLGFRVSVGLLLSVRLLLRVLPVVLLLLLLGTLLLRRPV